MSDLTLITAAPLTTKVRPLANGMGIRFSNDLTYDEWLEVGQHLQRRYKGMQWAVADWARHGSWRYGERYEAAIEATGLDYGTIRNYVSVAGKFSRRRDNLTIHHYAVVQRLDEPYADEWLAQAEEQGWSVRRLRDELNGSKTQLQPNTTTVIVRLSIPPDRQQRWQQAAERQAKQLNDWLTEAADEKAQRETT